LFIPVESIGNLVYIVNYYNGNWLPPDGVKSPNVTLVDVIGASSQIIMLFIFLSIMFIPGCVRTKIDNRRGIDKRSHKHY
jgi:hypothetical protein